MLLSIGMVGQAVKKLQAGLNLLPTQLVRLKEDGQFGTLTRGRVREFQGDNGLGVDGIVGPLTQGIIDALLSALGGSKPSTTSGAVRPINQEILDQPGTHNLVLQGLPSIGFVIPTTYRAHDQKNLPMFMSAPPLAGRLGIFAARKGAAERAVILMLPALGPADRIVVCVTQGFAQASTVLDPLGWSNPLSRPFIEFVLLKHVINRFGPQVLTSRPSTGLLYLVRAKASPELGPFASDGAFLKQVLGDLVALTNGAFSFAQVEAFTFSSGINDFNGFLGGLAGHLSVQRVYSVDPAPAIPAAAPKGATLRQFVTGATMKSPLAPAGFELVPEARWANEFAFERRHTFPPQPLFQYLHNHCAPSYFLRLGMTT